MDELKQIDVVTFIILAGILVVGWVNEKEKVKVMKNNKMIIIGAGVAGLSTGSYAQANGYRTLLLEMHDKPGGLCTAWQRKDYVFDGCIHHLAGAGYTSKFHPIWEQLGVSQLEMFFHDLFVRCEAPDGSQFNVFTNIDSLESHLKELAPEDAKLIDQYISAARRFTKFELLGLPLYGKTEMARLIPHLIHLPRWMKVTLDDFASRFKNPFLRRVFPYLQYGIPQVPLGVHLGFIAGCHNRTLGTPRADSLTFARSLEQRYLGLGGEIVYDARVEKILVEGDRAVGVRLADASEHRADLVVSAADGHSTIFEMLEGKYINELIRDFYANPPREPQPFAVFVCLGVARDLSGEPPAICYFPERPVSIGGQTQPHLNLELYTGPHYAPAGKGVMIVPVDSTYAYWSKLHQDRNRYREKKEQTAATVLEILEQRFPGIRGHVEVVDVATPLTMERYTGNYEGRQTWSPPRSGFKTMLKGLSRTLPGLDRFYMVGQWADAMIGISTAALSGRKLIQHLCRQEHRPFQVP